jgi:hypothetical protein
MSLFKSAAKLVKRAGKVVAKAGPLASFIPGGALITQASQYASLIPTGSRKSAAPAAPAFAMPAIQPAAYQGVSSRLPAPRTMGSVPVIAGMARANWGRIWRAVKVLGIGAVATALNVEVGTLAAQLIAHPAKRRRKGITARQLTNARRVNRVVCGWAKQLQQSPTRRTKRC